MLKVLIKKQFLELLQSVIINKQTGKARTKGKMILFACLTVLLFVCLGMSFYVMAYASASSFVSQGYGWLYLAFEGIIALALAVFGSIFNTYGILYLPKDNEMMLSLPIPFSKLIFSRVLAVYASSVVFGALIWIPSLIAYWNFAPINILNILLPVLLLFVIGLFASILSCLLGFAVAYIAKKTKGKSYVSVLITLAIMSAYYVVYFRILNSIDEILAHLDELSKMVQSRFFFFCLLGKAAEGDILSFVIVMAIAIVLSVICFFVLEKTFLKVAVPNGNSSAKKKTMNFKGNTLRTALLKREYRHFTSVSAWMLNGGFGLLVMIIGGVALLVKGNDLLIMMDEVLLEIPNVSSVLPLGILVAICMLNSTVGLTTVSLSMEGKSLWIARTLPISTYEILKAKERMALQLALIPSTFFVLAAGISLKISAYGILPVMIAMVLYVYFLTNLGMMMNLLMPNFSWSNEAYLCKQSMPVVIVMFGGWICSIGIAFSAYFLNKIMPMTFVLVVIGVLLAILCLIVHTWIKTKGVKIFNSL